MSVASFHRLTAAQPNLSHDPHRHHAHCSVIRRRRGGRGGISDRHTTGRVPFTKPRLLRITPSERIFLEDLKPWNHLFELLLQRLVILHILSALFHQMDKGVAEVRRRKGLIPDDQWARWENELCLASKEGRVVGALRLDDGVPVTR